MSMTLLLILALVFSYFQHAIAIYGELQCFTDTMESTKVGSSITLSKTQVLTVAHMKCEPGSRLYRWQSVYQVAGRNYKNGWVPMATIKADREVDLMLLEAVDATLPGPFARISTDIQVGDLVAYFGAGFRHFTSGLLSSGYVMAVTNDYLVISNTPFPGQSGSGIVNENGFVVGLNSRMFADGPENSVYSIFVSAAVPAQKIIQFLKTKP